MAKGVVGAKEETGISASQPKSRISQTDVPSYSLEQALRVPKAIIDNYGSAPTPPLRVAQALDMQPGSGGFRVMCGAALAYGLTTGGYNTAQIGIEELAKRIIRPTVEGDDLKARREAFQRPRIYGEFLRKYDKQSIPRVDIGTNVLVEMGVPIDRAQEVFERIVTEATELGLITSIKEKRYVDLGSSPEAFADGASSALPMDQLSGPGAELTENVKIQQPALSQPPMDPGDSLSARKRRVFISHGKDKSTVDTIRKLLTFGELEAVVSAEKQTVSQPVPEKIMSDMRTSGAAIIHVGPEMKLLDDEANEHIVLNPNVLIEIGAAMALYGQRFILLVRDGVKLPSNLQGLFEVRYQGDRLDGEGTIKLLEAINNLKQRPLPEEQQQG